tara:strand:+ start:5295 stop:5588 length:294 start_codon:yes stop_codon:yes gene_type:complete
MLEGFALSNNPSNSSNLLLFHANWCGHCKKMLPDWNKVKQEFPDRCKDVEFSNITDEDKDKYKLKGYPSIFIVKGDKIEEWKEGREYNDFKSFLQNN